MADLDDVPGFPLFTDARGCPINFKLLCDSVTKSRYKKLIEKHDGEVMKCQGLPRLLLASKTPCEHLHVGCEMHAPYSVSPVFNVSWVVHCISMSQLLEIKAYLLNPSPQFAQVNYMGQIDEGRYKPPPPSNATSVPSRCSYSEIQVPYNGAHERHVQELRALCSRLCRQSAPTENAPAGPGDIPSISPASSDAGNQEDITVDCMERFSSQPCSTPRVPPLTTNIGKRVQRPAANLALPQKAPKKTLALPLSLRRTASDEPDVAVPVNNAEPAHFQPQRTQKEPQVANSANPVRTQNASGKQQSSSTSNRLSLAMSSSNRESTEPKKNPRRRELFDSENFAPGFSDEESEDTPRIPRPSPPTAPIDLGETIEINEDRSPTPSPPHRSLASAPSTSRSPPRVPAVVQPNASRRRSSQSDSDSEFGPPPGSILKVKGVRQNTRAPYSREEELTILKYIKASKKLSGLRSNYIWREMDGKPGLERRSMQSLKEHFLKKMMGQLERYKIFTDDEIKKIRHKTS